MISIITPAYNEAQTLPFFIEKLFKEIPDTFKFEVIIVNDGSTDATDEKLEDLQKKFNLRIVSLSKNVGQQKAIVAGLLICKGASAIILDCDLQDNPSYIKEMISKWDKGFKIVLTQRVLRNDSIIKRSLSLSFYYLLNLLDKRLIPNVGDFFLIDRHVIDKVTTSKPRYLRGFLCLADEPKTIINISRDQRVAGESSYTFKKMFQLAFDGLATLIKHRRSNR